MRYINYIDFINLEDGKEFMEENPDTGTLKIEAFAAYQSVPIEDVSIIITKDIEDYRVIFFQGKTNSSGMIENIQLPAPKASNGFSDEDPKYTIYDITAVKEEYNTIKNFKVGMFGNVSVIQYVKMNVDTGSENGGVNNGN